LALCGIPFSWLWVSDFSLVVDGLTKRNALVIGLLVGFLLIGQVPMVNPVTPEQDMVPVIVDMDGVPSDFEAFLYLLKHPGVSVRAVTVSYRVTYIDEGVWSIMRLLDYLGIRDIPVAAVALTDPSVVTFEWHYIEVLTISGEQIGWTQSLDQDPSNTKVAVHADAELFETLFLETINYF
jgi:inosine-uridine nucleoside N-ribohydrolase